MCKLKKSLFAILRRAFILQLPMALVPKAYSIDFSSQLSRAFEAVNIVALYQKAPYIIDSIIVFIAFIVLAKKKLSYRIGNTAAVSVGIALSISMSFFLWKQGFPLFNKEGLLPSIITLFVILVLFFLFRAMFGITKKEAGIYLVVFAAASLVDMKYGFPAYSFLGRLSLVFIFFFIYCLVIFFKK